MLVIANWKMNASQSLIDTVIPPLLNADLGKTTISICPPFPYLTDIQKALSGSSITLGAQDVSPHKEGAYTGQVSAQMLKASGCQYVLVGHSERRQYNHESNELVVEKCMAAADAGLIPVLCVGENLEQRQSEQTEQVISEQLAPLLATSLNFEFVVAYEPVWAIGTGKSATPAMAEAVHAFIRKSIPVNSLKILYGGSVKRDNAKALFQMPNIDGGLIGGASLDPAAFIEICESTY